MYNNSLDMVKKESDEIQMQTCKYNDINRIDYQGSFLLFYICCFKWTTIYLYSNEFLFVLDLAKYSICNNDYFVHNQQRLFVS